MLGIILTCFIPDVPTDYESESATFDSPDQLQVAEIGVISTLECKRAYGSYVGDKQICSDPQFGPNFNRPATDACQGDSGGPLFVTVNEEDILIGISSWGAGYFLLIPIRSASLYRNTSQITSLLILVYRCADSTGNEGMGYPGVWTKLISYSTWIADISASMQYCDSHDSYDDDIDMNSDTSGDVTSLVGVTVNGCRCMAVWGISDNTCDDGSATYDHCGMKVPCDGDTGGVPGNSWCLLDEMEPQPSSCAAAGINWDHCVPGLGLCKEDHHVVDGQCISCDRGTTNAAGDIPSKGNTFCDVFLCSPDEHVVNHTCVQCPMGYTNSYGDPASGDDTSCNLATTTTKGTETTTSIIANTNSRPSCDIPEAFQYLGKYRLAGTKQQIGPKLFDHTPADCVQACIASTGCISLEVHPNNRWCFLFGATAVVNSNTVYKENWKLYTLGPCGKLDSEISNVELPSCYAVEAFSLLGKYRLTGSTQQIGPKLSNLNQTQCIAACVASSGCLAIEIHPGNSWCFLYGTAPIVDSNTAFKANWELFGLGPCVTTTTITTSTMKELEACPTTPVGYFDVGVTERVKQPATYLLGSRLLKKSTFECAQACIDWGPACVAFERTKNGYCELKSNTIASAGGLPNDYWTTYTRTVSRCIVSDVPETTAATGNPGDCFEELGRYRYITNSAYNIGRFITDRDGCADECIAAGDSCLGYELQPDKSICFLKSVAPNLGVNTVPKSNWVLYARNTCVDGVETTDPSTTISPGPCPESVEEMFGAPTTQRLRKTTSYTIGNRLFGQTVKSCAQACVNYGEQCKSFDMTRDARCELKSASISEIGGIDNAYWVNRERITFKCFSPTS